MLVYCRFFKKILVQQLQDGGLNLQPLELDIQLCQAHFSFLNFFIIYKHFYYEFWKYVYIFYLIA